MKPKPVQELEPVESFPIYSQVHKPQKSKTKTSVANKEDTNIVPIYDICSDPIYCNTGSDVTSSSFHHNIVPTHPVAVDLFTSYVKQCSNNDKLAFQEQFKVHKGIVSFISTVAKNNAF